MDTRYAELRRALDPIFRVENLKAEPIEHSVSPTGQYSLEVTHYQAGQNTWGCSRGTVRRTSDQQLVADVQRNYDAFWHAWVSHPNGMEYLLCGEDYQGYSVINLPTGISRVHFPDEGYEGSGFCWGAVFPSPDGLVLAVDGCYWACPYELVFYDFGDPESLPLPELLRIDGLWEVVGWDGSDFVAKVLIEEDEASSVPNGEPKSSLPQTRELRVPRIALRKDA